MDDVWISVSDMLPEIGVPVILFSAEWSSWGNAHLNVGEYWGLHWRLGGVTSPAHKPSHWMYFTPPPAEQPQLAFDPEMN
jgi:hypothetical protein